MKIEINAIDTLFFKDGKPFSMGDETWADGIFPPPPSVIYGALRTAYFAGNPGSLKDAGTKDDPTAGLKINAFYFSYGDVDYFPLPMDYVKKSDATGKEKNRAYLMKLSEGAVISSAPDNLRLLKPPFSENVEAVPDGIIGSGSLNRYFNADENETVFSSISEYVTLEPKTGIGRANSTRTSSDGKLYRVGMKRLAPVYGSGKQPISLSLIVDFDGVELPNKGFIKLGAEGKIASYSETDRLLPAPALKPVNNYIKLYLLTPAIFTNGWKPDTENHPVLKKFNLSLITACIGKPLWIGGFDMVKKSPKPMMKAVPSGSVYYYQTTSSLADIIKEVNGKSISDQRAAEGFGITLTGAIK